MIQDICKQPTHSWKLQIYFQSSKIKNFLFLWYQFAQFFTQITVLKFKIVMIYNQIFC